MSGYPSDMIDRSMLPKEDVPVLLKPVQPKDILTKIKESIGRGKLYKFQKSFIILQRNGLINCREEI